MRHYTTNENHGEDILKAIAKIEALENNFKYSQKEADEFTIGFAEWYLNLWHTDDDSSFDNNSPQELLELYKKEKGL